MEGELIARSQDGVLYLTINREAQGNSLNKGVIESMFSHLNTARGDRDIKAVCITGSGERFFCAGADLSSLLEDSQKGKDAVEGYASLMKFLVEYEKPVLARVNGACIGGGMGIVLSSDLAIAREDAYLASPELNWGIFPMMIGALMLRHIGPKKTMEMVFTGRRVYAPEAERIGLITYSVPKEALDEEVDKVLQKIRERSCAAMGLGKRAFGALWDMGFKDSLNFLSSALLEVFRTEDAIEGMRAFLEKRRPLFKGR